MVRKKHIIGLLFWIIIFIQFTSAQNSFDFNKETLKGKVKLYYPLKPISFCYNDIEILDPGFPIVPCDSGAFMPGLNKFYYKDKKKKINCLSISNIDATTYYINSTSKESTIHKLKKDNTSSIDSIIGKIDKGEYYIKAINRKLFYFYGTNEKGKTAICRFFNGKIDTLFFSNIAVSQLDILNATTLVFSQESSIVVLSLGSKPKKIFQCPDLIDGVAVGKDGSLFFSTKNGIFNIDKKFAISQITTGKIHGKLRFYKRGLFVLNNYFPCVLEIQPSN